MIDTAPNFPEVRVQLSYRKVVGKESQQAILEEVCRIAPYKVWLGIKWLCTYISIRPGELIKVREQDVDIGNRYIYIHHSKTDETKPVPILDEDVALFKQIKPGFHRAYFFRHDDNIFGTVQIFKERFWTLD